MDQISDNRRGDTSRKYQSGWLTRATKKVDAPAIFPQKRQDGSPGNRGDRTSIKRRNKEGTSSSSSGTFIGTPQLAVPATHGDEPALVHAIKSGNIAAFEELVRLHEHQLLCVAERVTRNHEDAQEAVQDAFLKLFNKLDQFQGNSKLSTWLFRVTINESCMKLRKQRKTRDLISLDPHKVGSLVGDIRDSAPNPEELRTMTEFWEHLIKASGKLGPSLWPTFWMRAVKGFSVDQTAGALNLTVSAVKARLYRSRVQLREELNKQSKRTVTPVS
ncbi:MAG: sigma-70 family RNA polymerase sigma factor [Candidatus Sulfotelmatobacter sp.]